MPLGLIFLAVLPSIVLAIVILIYDRFDKEPLKLLLKLFLFGALATIPSIIMGTVGNWFNIFGGSLLGIAFKAYIVVALSEEFFKRWAVMRHAFRHPAYNEKLDGIVYCAFSALGFAALENIMYVLTEYAIHPEIVWTRAILSVPAHLMMGITMGYYLSLAKYSTNSVMAKKYMRLSIIVPVFMHGTYDFILMANIPLLLIALVPFIIYMWISSIKKLNRFYRDSRDNHKTAFKFNQ